MRVTLLGTGDTVGMPVPLCDCRFCAEAEPRRRPGLLVEAGETTVVLDTGPDVGRQLVRAGATAVDSFFITHAHDDHLAGILDIQKLRAFAGEDVTVQASDEVRSYALERFPWLTLPMRTIEPGETTRLGELAVTAFPIAHSDAFPEQGYVVTDGDSSVAYAPDVWSLTEATAHRGVDLLFVDGLYLFGRVFEDDTDHAGPDRLRAEIERADADRVVLLNVSEHWHRARTADLEERAEPYEVWADFDAVSLG